MFEFFLFCLKSKSIQTLCFMQLENAYKVVRKLLENCF
jgi:hypothetical protein